MSEIKPLTQKQRYLQFLIPKLDDIQIEKMIAAVNSNTAMIADYRMRKLAAARGRTSPRAYYHAVFSGNPGCAKTSCARLYAKALAQEGITKTDRLAELSRSKIVDKYVGSTAQNVRKLFERNAGGVIFIDEAYTLCDSDPTGKNNFGIEAINELIVCMENHPETVVIFAGYTDKMEEFLSSNPGLRSRIPYTVAFSDYTTEELVAISRIIAGEQGYEIAESAIHKLSAIYDSARTQKDFGNGRYARNVVEAAVRAKGIRLGVMEKELNDLMDQTQYSDNMLFSLDETCFEIIPEPSEKPRHRIGFRA